MHVRAVGPPLDLMAMAARLIASISRWRRVASSLASGVLGAVVVRWYVMPSTVSVRGLPGERERGGILWMTSVLKV